MKVEVEYVSDLFFYVGLPAQWDEIPEEYEAPEATDGQAPRPELASLIDSLEQEIQNRGLLLEDVFEDAALHENASSNGVYLVFLDTPKALNVAEKTVQIFGPRVGVECFDPVRVGPAVDFEAPTLDAADPPPTPPGL